MGVFKYLAGTFGEVPADNVDIYLVKDRFTTDLPEMQTIAVYDNGRFAYWRLVAASSYIRMHVFPLNSCDVWAVISGVRFFVVERRPKAEYEMVGVANGTGVIHNS